MKKLRKLFGVILIILALVVMQLPVSEASAAATVSDFSIDKDGVLTKYNGTQTAVVIPDGVTAIATDAFKNNQKVTSITMPKSVTAIAPYAFWNCSSLVSVSIGNGLDEIGDFAFANCKSLASVYVPANIRRIGIYAFQDALSLTDITIPPQTFEIHETAFDGCKKLVIHATEGTYAYKYAQDFYKRQQEFNEYEDVADFNPGADADGDGSDKEDGNDNSPSGNSPSGNDDSGLGNSDVDTSNGTQLSSVHIVGNKAVFFMDSASPTVYYGNQTNVQNNADGSTEGAGTGAGIDNESSDISGLPKYTIVDNEIIADQAYYCSNKPNYVALPDTIKEIGQFSYARSSVSSIVLPEGLETISYGAFYHCDNLEFVTIPSTVTKIEPKAFEKSAWVEKFLSGAASDSDFLISGDVLVAYKGITSEVIVPDGVRLIAADCFKGHDEIESISLPESIRIIGEDAFSGCTKLSSVNLEETGVESILDRAFDNTGIKTVLTPKSLMSLGLKAFPENASVSYEGNAPALTHEVTAERLSNADYRVNVYKSDETHVLQSKGEVGVNVDGPEGIKAYLEGEQDYYYLTVLSEMNDKRLDRALARASEILSGRKLICENIYDLELTDESGIKISKLGKAALTVAIPLPQNLEGHELTIFTVDRNGQLEEIVPEIISVDDKKYVRFMTYHLSPFAIYSTGNVYEDGKVLYEETVFSSMAAPMQERSFTDNLSAWASLKKWRLVAAGLLVITGFLLIFVKKATENP